MLCGMWETAGFREGVAVGVATEPRQVADNLHGRWCGAPNLNLSSEGMGRGWWQEGEAKVSWPYESWLYTLIILDNVPTAGESAGG